LAFGIAIPTFPLRREPTRRPARRRIGAAGPRRCGV